MFHDPRAGAPAEVHIEEVTAGVRALLEGQRRVEGLLDRLVSGDAAVAADAGLLATGSLAASAASKGRDEEQQTEERTLRFSKDSAFSLTNTDDEQEPPMTSMHTLFSTVSGIAPAPRASQYSARRESQESDTMMMRGTSGDSLDVGSNLPDWFLHVQLRDELRAAVDLGLISKFSAKRATKATRAASGVSNGNGRKDFGSTRSKSLELSSALASMWTARRRQPIVIRPSSFIRFVMDVFSLVVLAYDAVTIPLTLAFETVPRADWARWLSCASVVYWSVDMLSQFRTGFYVDGALEMRPKFITRHYLRGFFALDFTLLLVDVVSLSVNLLYSDSGETKGTEAITLVRTIRAARLLRLVNGMRVQNLTGISARAAVFRQASRLLNSPLIPLAKEIAKSMIMIVFLNHLIACIWCFMGRDPFFVSASDTGLVWLDMDSGGVGGPYRDYGNAYQYSTGVHWSLTQMTPGSMQAFPVNTAERVFNSLCLMLGFLVFSTLISSLSAGVSQLQFQMISHRANMNKLTTFLARVNVSTDVRVQVCKLVDFKLKYRPPLILKDVEALLAKLPLALRNSLQLELTQTLLEHYYFNFLSNAHCPAWEEVCRTCTDFSIHFRRDTLFVSGTEASGMYFMLDNRLSYTVDGAFVSSFVESPETTRLEAGRWLSEAALWCTWRHTGTAEVEESASCEVLFLDSPKLLKCLSKHTLVSQLSKAYAQSFYQFLVHSRPPLCDWPSDLTLAFGTDEVIAAMPRDAKVILGQAAVQALMDIEVSSLAGFRRPLRADKAEQLIAEASLGTSTLLSTSSGGLVRCVPLVALRLTRRDGRMLVSLKIVRTARGGYEAFCKLPGGKQKASEHPEDCFRRLLGSRLEPLSEGLNLQHTHRETQSERSQRFGVPTRYIRTVIEATWKEEHDATVEAKVWRQRRASEASSESAGTQEPESAKAAKRYFGTDERTGKRGGDANAADGHSMSGVNIYEFAADEYYAWLSQEDFLYFGSLKGRSVLYDWLVSKDVVHLMSIREDEDAL